VDFLSNFKLSGMSTDGAYASNGVGDEYVGFVDFAESEPIIFRRDVVIGLNNSVFGRRDRSVGRHAQIMAVASCSQSQKVLSIEASFLLG
jgi:hypothetical protein